MRGSIVMATYNGELFLRQQMDSILLAMDPKDELLVADDGSTDSTISIIMEYEENDSRVRLLPDHTHKGIQRNFSYAIEEAKGDIIFLADQDDIWFPNKIHDTKRLFVDDPDLTCVLADLTLIDGEGKQIGASFFDVRHVKSGFWNNFKRNSYIGNAMAFRATLKSIVLPIPESVPMHDQWIGMLSERYGKSLFYPHPLGAYRRHGNNVTQMQHGSVVSMLSKRIRLLQNIVKRHDEISKIGV